MNDYINVWKKCVDFSGRAQRREYWMFVLFNFIAVIILGIIDMVLHNSLLQGFYGLAIFIPTFAVAVQRLHDIGRSGWWLLIDLIPIVGTVIIFIFTVTDSQSGENQYGPNPKGIQGTPVTS